MSFKRWGYTFEGAWTDPIGLESRSGVYVIWCKSGQVWAVMDVGESHDVKNRVLTHDRRPDWLEHCSGTIYYCATYTPKLQQAGRMEIEKRIRNLEKPPCGDR